MEEFESAISVIKKYMDDFLFEPKLTWPDNEFDTRCYSRWAAEEILERIILESEKLPEYITNKNVKKPLELIKDFINELHIYTQIYNDNKNSIIFYIAERTAIDIALLFL